MRRELRVVPRPEYDEWVEGIAATLTVGQSSVFVTTVLLDTSGTLVSAKVYAITSDGRESSSGAVQVQVQRQQGGLQFCFAAGPKRGHGETYDVSRMAR